MTKTYGLKISRPGFDVNRANPNELSFSSQFKTLKVKSYGSGSLTDGSRTATIAHNLGYVPFFMVHGTGNSGNGSSFYSSGEYGLLPLGTSGILANPAVGLGNDLFAYADSTNLYIKAQSNFGVISYPGSDGSTISKYMAFEGSLWGYDSSQGWYFGNNLPSFGAEKGAIRFGPSGIALTQAQSIYKATLNLYIGYRTGSGQVKGIVYGIDEDNTGDFNAGTPATARTKTTASTTTTTTASLGNTLSIDVTSQVQEIVNRAGWSSGNKMGFIIDDNGTTASNNYGENTTSQSTLDILISNTIASYKYTIFENQLE